jgi:hypothetical protein
MQKFKVKRFIIANTAILGKFFNEAGMKLAYVLENPYRNTPKDSAIPCGTYQCEKDTTGKFQFYKVLNVPGRANIEIHQGNYERDTEGCILLGGSWAILNDELAISNSVKTLERLKKILPEKFLLEISE